jgi:hypothetical protein
MNKVMVISLMGLTGLVIACREGPPPAGAPGDAPEAGERVMIAPPGEPPWSPSERPPAEIAAPEAAPDARTRYQQQGTNVFTQIIPDGGVHEEWPHEGEDRVLRDRILVMMTFGTTGTQGRIAESQIAQANDFSVQVRNGEVWLRGTVRSDEDRQTYERQVRALESVREVHNQMAVDPNI